MMILLKLGLKRTMDLSMLASSNGFGNYETMSWGKDR
jgi:hypothetical protein